MITQEEQKARELAAWLKKTNAGQIVNLTPHAIKLVAGFGFVEFPSPENSFNFCRVDVQQEKVGELAGARVHRQVFGKVLGLPEPAPGVTYIVSAMVLAALAGLRADVVAPDTGEGAIRDGQGRITGTRGWVR